MRRDGPPALAMRRRCESQSRRKTLPFQHPIQRRASLALFDNQHPQTTVQPLIHVDEDPRRVRETEVGLPSREIAPQFPHHCGEAAATAPGGDLPKALLQLRQGFR